MFLKNRIPKYIIIGLTFLIPTIAFCTISIMTALPPNTPIGATAKLAQLHNINAILLLNYAWGILLKNTRIALPRGYWGI